MVQGGAAGLPPLFAETLLGLPMKAEFPAGASAKRAAIPAPNPSALPKTMVQSGGQVPEATLDFWSKNPYDNLGSWFPSRDDGIQVRFDRR